MNITARSCLWFMIVCFATVVAAQQEPTKTGSSAPSSEVPTANPARPTVSTPATLPPTGYLQFETGGLSAWHSPGLSSQTSFNEVVKFAFSSRLEILAAAELEAHSRVVHQTTDDPGGVSLGLQTILYKGEGARPTIAASYFHQFYGGSAPDLDIGSFSNSLFLLASADVRGFHYDTNYLINEVVNNGIRRGQFGQTLSVSHAIGKRFGISGEIWHFTQPFLRGHAVGNLWAVSYTARKNLVFDGGFNRGLTDTSARWELFAGFTYLLPHRLLGR
jgi:hypothetical protein